MHFFAKNLSQTAKKSSSPDDQTFLDFKGDLCGMFAYADVVRSPSGVYFGAATAKIQFCPVDGLGSGVGVCTAHAIFVHFALKTELTFFLLTRWLGTRRNQPFPRDQTNLLFNHATVTLQYFERICGILATQTRSKKIDDNFIDSGQGHSSLFLPSSTFHNRLTFYATKMICCMRQS